MAGERILVHGAAGGASTAFLELGKAGPARGVRHGVDYRAEDFVARVAAPTGGRGVDAALDPIGGGHPSQEPGGSASDCARLDPSWLGTVPRVRQRSDGVRGEYVVPCLAFYNAIARPGSKGPDSRRFRLVAAWRDLVRSATLFHWWPKRIRKRKGPRRAG